MPQKLKKEITERLVEKALTVENFDRERKKLNLQYCSCCDKFLSQSLFMRIEGSKVNKSGLFSVCQNCQTKIYDNIKNQLKYSAEEDCIYQFCKIFNIVYDESIANKTVADSMVNAADVSNGIRYIQRLQATDKVMTPFGDSEMENEFSKLQQNREQVKMDQLKNKWGDFSLQDFIFLEEKYNEYVQAFGSSSPAEEDAYKTLAVLILRQKTDPANIDLAKAVKAQLELIGISPEKLRKESKDKDSQVLGLAISKMEQTDPADYYNDPKMYFDHDGLEKDVQSIIRATKNFMVDGSNDYAEDDLDLSEIQLTNDDSVGK